MTWLNLSSLVLWWVPCHFSKGAHHCLSSERISFYSCCYVQYRMSPHQPCSVWCLVPFPSDQVFLLPDMSCFHSVTFAYLLSRSCVLYPLPETTLGQLITGGLAHADPHIPPNMQSGSNLLPLLLCGFSGSDFGFPRFLLHLQLVSVNFFSESLVLFCCLKYPLASPRPPGSPARD